MNASATGVEAVGARVGGVERDVERGLGLQDIGIPSGASFPDEEEEDVPTPPEVAPSGALTPSAAAVVEVLALRLALRFDEEVVDLLFVLDFALDFALALPLALALALPLALDARDDWIDMMIDFLERRLRLMIA